jgi:hypothetical protein
VFNRFDAPSNLLFSAVRSALTAEQDSIGNAIGNAKFRSRAHDPVVSVYDAAGNVIEAQERFQILVSLIFRLSHIASPASQNRSGTSWRKDVEQYGYGTEVRVSNLRSTPLRDVHPNRRNSSLPKLQCRGHRSDYLYITSPRTGAITGKKTLRDHRDFGRRLCGGADQPQETDKTDRRFHRCAELADSSVRRVPWRTVFRVHFRSQGKEIRV